MHDFSVHDSLTCLFWKCKAVSVVTPQWIGQDQLYFQGNNLLKTLQKHRTGDVASAFCPACPFFPFGKIERQNISVINFLSKHRPLQKCCNIRGKHFACPPMWSPLRGSILPGAYFCWRDTREDDGVKTRRRSAVSAGRACGLLQSSSVIVPFKSTQPLLEQCGCRGQPKVWD